MVRGIIPAWKIYFTYKNKPNMRKKIVAGNWKMNTLPAEGVELAKGVVAGRGEVCSCVNFIVCPPFTHLAMVAEALKGSDVALGAQDCATEAKGAYTGEIAASMIAALGCKYVILGHSERRQYYGETSETLNKKMVQAYANGLTPIYCVGENLEEREGGKHFDVVKAQIEEVVYNLTEEQYKTLVIAYEPVWAIGTGKTASAEQAQEIHAYIRKVLAEKFGARTMVGVGICVYMFICVFAFFMNSLWQFWVLAVLVGMFQGGVQALSRSHFAKIIPVEKSGEYFGLFDICGKGASFLGTMIVSVGSQLTGSANVGIGMLALLFAVGFVLFRVSCRTEGAKQV